MRKLVLPLIILITLLCASCKQRCESGNLYLRLEFRDSVGLAVNPVFDRVQGINQLTNFAENTKIDSIPINQSTDSTIMLFELNGHTDTLAFSYKRELNVGNNTEGYCLKLYDPAVMDQNSFGSTNIVFHLARRDGYQAKIRF